jgi:hypothetical protein
MKFSECWSLDRAGEIEKNENLIEIDNAIVHHDQVAAGGFGTVSLVRFVLNIGLKISE